MFCLLLFVYLDIVLFVYLDIALFVYLDIVLFLYLDIVLFVLLTCRFVTPLVTSNFARHCPFNIFVIYSFQFQAEVFI